MNPFTVTWRAARDLFDELFLMMGLNLVWLLMSGPLIALAIWLALNGSFVLAAIAALIGILPYGPASAGLGVVAERIVDGRVAAFSVFVAGMRSYRVLSWKIYGLWILGLVILLFNLGFYLQLGGTAGFILSILLGYVSATWLTLMIYLGPLMILQESKSVRLIWRNAAVLALGRPVFTLLTSLLMGIIIFISFWAAILPLILTFSWLTLWSMRATTTQIALDAERRAARLAAEDSDQPQANRGRKGQVQSRK